MVICQTFRAPLHFLTIFDGDQNNSFILGTHYGGLENFLSYSPANQSFSVISIFRELPPTIACLLLS